jgi:hypothetical protein
MLMARKKLELQIPRLTRCACPKCIQTCNESEANATNLEEH